MKTSCEYFGGCATLIDEPAGRWFKLQSDLVRRSLEDVDLAQMGSTIKASEFIRQSIERPLKTWSTKALFTSAFPPIKAMSNYRIDYQVRNLEIEPNLKEQVTLELAFDNRQAVGTNLLKLESSARQFASDTGGTCMSVLIAPSQDLKDLGFWDNSVATAPEYSWAIRVAYKFLLISPLVLLTVS